MTRRHTVARGHYDDFVHGYVTAMLWSSTDNSDESSGVEHLDANYGVEDIARESMKKIKRDCAKFMKANKNALNRYVSMIQSTSNDPGDWEMAGHDFWLTRNGHGTGFWDRDYLKPLPGLASHDPGEELTKASKKFGEVWPYVGDDGKVHV